MKKKIIIISFVILSIFNILSINKILIIKKIYFDNSNLTFDSFYYTEKSYSKDFNNFTEIKYKDNRFIEKVITESTSTNEILEYFEFYDFNTNNCQIYNKVENTDWEKDDSIVVQYNDITEVLKHIYLKNEFNLYGLIINNIFKKISTDTYYVLTYNVSDVNYYIYINKETYKCDKIFAPEIGMYIECKLETKADIEIIDETNLNQLDNIDDLF